MTDHPKKTTARPPRTAEMQRVEQTLTPAEVVSQHLKIVSKEARAPTTPFTRFFRDSRGRPLQPFVIGIIFAFLLVVIIPIATSGIYLAFFTSDQYASEVRFAVRGGSETSSPGDLLSGLTGSTSAIRLQDSLILADFIRGRGMVEILEDQLQLRKKFSGPHVDYVFGFNPNRSIERLVKYWWWQVDVQVDRISGIITVVVSAFTAKDAFDIANVIISASEKLVNDLSERARRDALRTAQNELTLAERLLQSKIAAMKQLRTSEQVLDPTKQSEALTKVISDMRLELVRMESDYAAQRKNVDETAPQMRVLDARIRAAREQIKLLEARMTSVSPDQKGVLAESISHFDRLRLEQEFAQKQYIAAAAALERARLEVESQQVYLTTFLRPVLAEEGIYPRRWWIMLAITILCLTLWGLGTGAAVLIRNHAH